MQRLHPLGFSLLEDPCSVREDLAVEIALSMRATDPTLCSDGIPRLLPPVRSRGKSMSRKVAVTNHSCYAGPDSLYFSCIGHVVTPLGNHIIKETHQAQCAILSVRVAVPAGWQWAVNSKGKAERVERPASFRWLPLAGGWRDIPEDYRIA